MKPENKALRSGHIYNYAVGFFDLLGQSDGMKPIIHATLRGISEDVIRDTLQEQEGKVRNHRAVFEGFFDGVTNVKVSGKTGPGLNLAWFSDSVMLWQSVSTKEEGIDPTGLFDIISGAALASMMLLAEGIALRGGIEVDVAGEFFEGELYGPALLCAYRLESGIASWPRVVIGESALALLKNLIPGDPAAKIILDRYMRMLFEEPGGQVFVDFAGAGVLDRHRESDKEFGSAEEASAKKQFEAGQKFARQELEKFERSQEPGAGRVADKYRKLLAYLDDRADLWK